MDLRDYPAESLAEGKEYARKVVSARFQFPPEVVDDIMGDLNVRIETGIQYDGTAKIGTFLYGITRHIALDYLRRKGRKEGKNRPLDEAVGHADTSTHSPHAIAEFGELVQLVRACLVDLPPRQRDAFLDQLGGESVSDIAARQNSSQNAISMLIYRAKEHLRESLADYLLAH